MGSLRILVKMACNIKIKHKGVNSRIFNFKKSHLVYILLAILALVIIFYSLIRPAIIGYATYKNIMDYDSSLPIQDYLKNFEELKQRLDMTAANLSSQQHFNEKIMVNLNQQIEDLKKCEIELAKQAIIANMTTMNFEKEILALKSDLEQKEESMSQLQKDNIAEVEELKNKGELAIEESEKAYEYLAQNLANNLCCKAKIDNKRIGYYIVENDMIVCLESSGKEIRC